MTKKHTEIFLSIAGYDGSGGAGILLDIKVWQSLGFYGMGIITSNTIQNTEGIKYHIPVEETVLKDQWEHITKDIKVSGIKIGLIPNEDILRAITSCVSNTQNKIPIILDTIYKSSDGTLFYTDDMKLYLIENLIPICTLVTPNIPEAMWLTDIIDYYDPKELLINLRKIIEPSILLKCGHLEGKSSDFLLIKGKYKIADIIEIPTSEKLKGEFHGTGCAYSSSILAYYILNSELANAVIEAKKFISNLINNSISPGKGKNLLFP